MPFDPYLQRWNLTPDGEPIHTRSSDLLPVRMAGRPAMLKVARIEEERRGNSLMVWWRSAAAEVLRHDGEAVVLERLGGRCTLMKMVRAGQDDEATRILCRVVGSLHHHASVMERHSHQPRPDLPPLVTWFQALEETAPWVGGVMILALETAQRLLQESRIPSVLHGDIHHGNVLHSRKRGWLAIDPKGLIGERSFDYANILCNPSLEVATTPGRLTRQSFIVAEAAGLDRHRLLQWVLAYAGLSAAWHLEDGEEAQARQTLTVASLAAAELNV